MWVSQEGLDCRHCTKQIKKARGCEGFESKKDIQIYDDKIQVSICPIKEVSLESRIILETYHFYKRGFLPSPGGWMEQSARMIEAFCFLDGFFSELEQKEREKMRNKKEEITRGKR